MNKDISTIQFLQKADEIFATRDHDAKYATEQLIKNISKFVNDRSYVFLNQYKELRKMCVDYSDKYSKFLYEKYEPQVSAYNAAKSAFFKIEDEVNYAYWKLNRLSGNSPKKRQARKDFKNKKAQFEIARKSALMAFDALDEPQFQIDKVNELLKEISTSTRDIESFSFKLLWRGIKLKYGIRTIKVFFWGIALVLTFIIDNYTSVFDSFFLKYDKQQYHTITILLIFIIQISFFDKAFSIISKKVYWLFYGNILKSFKEILPEIESTERSLAEAQELYNKLQLIT